jgi:hypothetical protein
MDDWQIYPSNGSYPGQIVMFFSLDVQIVFIIHLIHVLIKSSLTFPMSSMFHWWDATELKIFRIPNPQEMSQQVTHHQGKFYPFEYMA